MVLATLAAAIIFAYAVQVQCGDVPDRSCATLFSQENFGGESFTLNDFDQSADFKREYRHTAEGWPDTKSFRVENGCAITACSQTYFQGSCKTFTSEKAALSQLMSTVKSANCSCERICRCEDFYLSDNEMHSYGNIGRAYHSGGCDTCNSEYKTLQDWERSVGGSTIADMSSVEAIVLHNGCNISFFKDNKHFNIQGPVYRGHIGMLPGYDVTCQPSKPKDGSSEFKAYFPLGDLSGNSKALQEMLISNKTLASHPGVRAALDSGKVNRSSRHVYVIIIGYRVTPEQFVFSKCSTEYLNKKTGEYINKIRMHSPIRNSIQISLSKYVIDDAMNDLDEYLSSHEELSHNIPNAVIVTTAIHLNDKNTNFQKTLNDIKNLRHRLIDDNYSNLIFELRSLHMLNPIEQRMQPEAKLAEFEEIIRGKLDFINPVAFSLSSGPQKTALDHMNGYARIDNGEFWPRNLEIGLVNICEKSGDTLGKSVLRAHFQENLPPRSNTRPIREGSGIENQIERGTMDDGCGCESIKSQLKQEIEKLKSELQVERTERLVNADRIKADLWEEFKLKWKMHFEL